MVVFAYLLLLLLKGKDTFGVVIYIHIYIHICIYSVCVN